MNSSITHTMKAQSGFTLIELLVTLAVLSILIAIAAPNFTSTISGNKVGTTTNDLVGALAFARSEAITRNTSVTITAAGGTPSWVNGWTIATTAETIRESGPMPSTFTATTPSGSALASATMTITFNPDGSLASKPFDMKICDTNNQGANTGRSITITNTGRSNIKATNFTCP